MSCHGTFKRLQVVLHVLQERSLEVGDLGGVHHIQEATVDGADLQDDQVTDANSQDDDKVRDINSRNDLFTWSSMGMGTYWPCLMSSASLAPLLRGRLRVELGEGGELPVLGRL